MYDPDSDNELNEDFGMVEYDDNTNNCNKEHIQRAKGQPIKNNKNNRPSSTTVNKSSLKATRSNKIYKGDNYETMDTSYNKEEDEDEGITLDSEPSTP